jgi:type IV pilus assembly protein PilY1
MGRSMTLGARVVGCALLMLATPASALSYAGGSLIIPGQASYQDYCGTASSYGLIYKVLQANSWLQAQGKGRITVHWAYKATKASPNRCVPTDIQKPPVYGSYTNSNPPPWNDAIWNDGCDFRIVDTTSVPVTLIKNSTGAAVDDSNIVTISTVGDNGVYPQYSSVTVKQTTTPKVTSVGYLGGPFIIAASDAPTFLQLLSGALLATDSNGYPIDFTAFRTPGTCSFGSTSSTHYVRIHRAQTQFSADDNTNFNAPPPRLALLATGSGVSNGILQNYLTSAGLNFTGAAGCPAGGVNATNPFTCPTGGTPGAIYDTFDVADFASNLQNNTDASGLPLYTAIWTPHWDIGTSPTTTQVSAVNNIAQFLNGQTGLFAECASIASYEGATMGGSPQTSAGSIASQFQTCVKDPAHPGSCGTATITYGIEKNTPTSSNGSYMQNCTDPTAVSGQPCIYFPNAGDPFIQIGDYKFFNQSGNVQNYLPNTTSNVIYRPSTISLAFNVASLDKTKLTTAATARTMAVSDESTRSLKDGSPAKANILYLAGHTYDTYEAGTRVVLGTLLQLGLVLSTQETGFSGATLYNNSVFVPTYDRITSVPTSASVKKFDSTAGSQFVFPYHSGHLKTHLLSALAQGNNQYTDVVQWDAKLAMPKPQKRNLFTFLGGSVNAPTTSLARQVGWTPIDFDYTSIQSPAGTCLDNFHIGPVAANATTGKPGPYVGMVPGGNGVCDLEELVAENMILTASDLGSDYGAAEQAAIKTKLLDTTVGSAVQTTQQLTQLVRGFCFATVGNADGSGAMIANPASTDCNYHRQDDIISLGGIVHSQVAVVAASPFVPDAPVGKHRPTVAYVGGLDGQIHALYVPSPDTNDQGYTGPASAPTLPFSSARGAFHTDWLASGSFAPPRALTELWSFLPPGQIPFLYSNDAMVDSSPAVLDVFGDFTGNGIRTWHTVLVASAGGNNREIFAIDVTNPLSPTLLWDIQSTYDPSLPYAPTTLMDDNTGKLNLPDEQAFQWQNRCRASEVSAGTCTAANFALPPVSDPGRSTSGLFNYAHLGASQSVSAAMLRRNNAPVFAAFIATNEPSGNGMYVFAIDIPTGQKIWELNNPYDKASDPSGMADGLDNSPPAGVSLLSKAGTSLIDTVYAGDLEGSLFELDAADGLNQTSYVQQIGSSCTAAGSCNFALSNAYGYDPNGYPQPITTQSTIFVVPPGVASTSPFSPYAGLTLLAYGTAGTDKVSSLGYTVTGSVHVLPLSPAYRLQSNQVIGPPSKFSQASSKGVATEVSGYPLYVTAGERLYGSITAAGDHLYFGTTSGTVTNIDSRGHLGGATYSVDLGATFASSLSTLANTAGGTGGTVLVAKNASGQTQVITVTDQQINVSPPQTIQISAPPVNGVGKTPSSFLGWFFRATGHEY